MGVLERKGCIINDNGILGYSIPVSGNNNRVRKVASVTGTYFKCSSNVIGVNVPVLILPAEGSRVKEQADLSRLLEDKWLFL